MTIKQYQIAGTMMDYFIDPNTGVTGPRVFVGPTDPISGIPVMLDYPHHQLHEGETHQYTIAPAALSSGSSILLRVVVPALVPTLRTPHITIEVDATAETWLYLYETPTTTGNGSLQVSYNRNRNSANVASSGIYLTPTVTGNGTLLSAWILGSGTKGGGGARDSLEWDLKASEVYLIVITSKAASNNVCARVIYYEDLGV